MGSKATVVHTGGAVVGGLKRACMFETTLEVGGGQRSHLVQFCLFRWPPFKKYL